MKFLMSTAAIAALAFVPTTANAGGSACGVNPCSSGYTYGASRYGGNGPAGYYGGGHGYGNSYSYGSASHYGGYGHGGIVGSGFIGGPIMNGPTFVNSGQYISGPIIPVTRYIQPAPRLVPMMSQPRTVFTAPVYSGITYAAPNVRLAGPPIRSTVVRHTVRTQHMPIARAERYVDPVMADCPAETTPQPDGTCLERTYTAAPTYTPAPRYTPPMISRPYNPPQMANCPAGTTKQSDGTCLERSFSYGVTLPDTHRSSASYSVTLPDTHVSAMSYRSANMANCPAGTSKQSDGTCLSSSVTSYTSSTTYTAPAPSYHVPDTIVRAQDEYCYAGSSKRYDSLGNEIKSRHSEHCRQH